MSLGLTKGEKPAWNTRSGRAGTRTMEHVADSASAARVRHARKAATAGRRPGAAKARKRPAR